MGNLPGMAVGVDEDARVAAPERRGAGAGDRGARLAGLGEDGIDLLGGADVVGERHAAPAAAVGDTRCRRRACPVPQGDDEAGAWKKATWSVSSSTPPSRCQPSAS